MPRLMFAALALASGCSAVPLADAPQEPIVATPIAPEERKIADAGTPAAKVVNASFAAHTKADCDAFPADPCPGRLIGENGLKGMPVDFGACRIPARPLGAVRKVSAVIDGVRITLRAEDVRRAAGKRIEGDERKRFPVEAAIADAIDAPGGAGEVVFLLSSSAEADREALERWGFLLTGLLRSSPFEVRDEAGAPGDHVILYDWGYYCGPLCGASGRAVYTTGCKRIYFSREMIS